MKRSCSRAWQVDLLRQGGLGSKDVNSFERHVVTCADCSSALARDRRLHDLAHALRSSEPSELVLRRTRARVLRDHAVARPRSRRALMLSVAAAMLVAGGALAWTRVRGSAVDGGAPRISEAESAAARAPVIVAAVGTRWSQRREGDVTFVHLDEGSLHVLVPHQGATERFLVELPDGELEVRGTVFTVATDRVATSGVWVEQGIVALRLRPLPSELVLRAGERWASTPAFTTSASSPAPPPSAPAAVAPAPVAHRTPSRSPGNAVDAETSRSAGDYAAAIVLFQRADYGDAADAFRRFVLAYPAAVEAEDASFLQASALARAGRPDAAALVAEDHLARFPRSFHRKEASILVARAARDRGDCARVRTVLSPWKADDSDPNVRAALGACPGADE